MMQSINTGVKNNCRKHTNLPKDFYLLLVLGVIIIVIRPFDTIDCTSTLNVNIYFLIFNFSPTSSFLLKKSWNIARNQTPPPKRHIEALKLALQSITVD